MSDSVRKTAKDGKLLYHMTPIKNLNGIFKDGKLKPRSELESANFNDTANHEILDKRKAADLDKYVPFHFFMNGPYDGSVRKAHPDESFAYICVYRETIKEKCGIIVGHPLHSEKIEIKSWNDGIELIDWKLIEKRDYHDEECKQMCMSEAVHKGALSLEYVQSIRVPKKYIGKLNAKKESLGLRFYANEDDNLLAENEKDKNRR
jgi:hypothetical protein